MKGQLLLHAAHEPPEHDPQPPPFVPATVRPPLCA